MTFEKLTNEKWKVKWWIVMLNILYDKLLNTKFETIILTFDLVCTTLK